MSQLVFEARPYEDPDVVRMVAEVQAHYAEIYGGPDEAAVDVDEFAPPRGKLFVGFLDGVAVAMGGWRRLPDAADGTTTAELKRMYTSPTARRLGVARQMLAAVERDAAAAGVEVLVLNTGPHQAPAIALYEAQGYEPCPPFGHYACHGQALFFAKPLADSTTPASPQ